MYGKGPLGARIFCKECMERCNRPISYENACKLSLGIVGIQDPLEYRQHWTHWNTGSIGPTGIQAALDRPLEEKCWCIGN